MPVMLITQAKPAETAAPAGVLTLPAEDYVTSAPEARPSTIVAEPVVVAEPVTNSVVASSDSSYVSSSSPAASAPASHGFGLTYSPYNSDGTCKSAAQVLVDFDNFGGAFATVRTYGIDCNTVPNMLAAVKAHGMKLFQGIFDINNIEASVRTIVGAVGGDWSDIHTISVGNELVNSGQASAGAVVNAMNTARGLLRAAGYNGPVVTCDTLVATLANPSLCDNADYCAVNSHPFFDPNTEASQAGNFLTAQLGGLKNVLANRAQDIVITETGWPSKGDANGAAVPSTSNQATAIAAIKSAFASNPAGVVLFNPYNMHWKVSNANQFNAESWWGFLGECPSG
jgi:exo-beta-1,3-glucanase (GH17 family)